MNPHSMPLLPIKLIYYILQEMASLVHKVVANEYDNAIPFFSCKHNEIWYIFVTIMSAELKSCEKRLLLVTYCPSSNNLNKLNPRNETTVHTWSSCIILVTSLNINNTCIFCICSWNSILPWIHDLNFFKISTARWVNLSASIAC